MEITIVQAFLIGVVYYLGINGTPWLSLVGSTIIQKPIVSGLLVGVIMGDPVQGAIVGAAIQLPFIAYISAGGAPPTDPGLAGTLGAALALAARVDPMTAIAIATPIGLLGTIIWVVHMTVDVAFAHMCDRAAEKGDMRALAFWHLCPPQIVAFLIGVVPVTLGAYFGSGVVTGIINAMQGRPLETLQVIGGILPAIGIAMNLRALDRPGIILWFILGFVVVQYSGIGTLPLAVLAGIAAWFITDSMTGGSKNEPAVQVATAGGPGGTAARSDAGTDRASVDSDDDFE